MDWSSIGVYKLERLEIEIEGWKNQDTQQITDGT